MFALDSFGGFFFLRTRLMEVFSTCEETKRVRESQRILIEETKRVRDSQRILISTKLPCNLNIREFIIKNRL